MTKRSLEEREAIAWAEYRNACPAYGDHSDEAVAIEQAAHRRLKRELVAIKHDARRLGLEAAYASSGVEDDPALD